MLDRASVILRQLPERVESALAAELCPLEFGPRVALRNQGPFITGWLASVAVKGGDMFHRRTERFRRQLQAGWPSATELPRPALRLPARATHEPPPRGTLDLLAVTLQPNATRALAPVLEHLPGRCALLIDPWDAGSLRIARAKNLLWQPFWWAGPRGELRFMRDLVELRDLCSEGTLSRLLERIGVDEFAHVRAVVRQIREPLFRQLVRAAHYAHVLRFCLTRFQPRNVLFVTHRAATDEVLESVRFSGGKIFFLQGIVPQVPPLRTSLRVDLAVAGSLLDQDYLERCGIAPDKTRLVGYPDYDHLARVNAAEAKRRLIAAIPELAERRLVVFTSQYKTSAFPDWARRLHLELLTRVARRMPECEFVIRPHPRLERIDGPYVNSLPPNVRVSTELSTIDVMASADVVVTYWSTTALEAVLLGTPLVQLNATGLPDFFPLSQMMGTSCARDEESLLASIEHALSSDARTTFQEQRSSFLRSIHLELDGRAALRAADALMQVMARQV